MDPNATYDEMCDLTNAALSGVEVDAMQLAELVEALDLWICGGGFLPGAWSNHA